MTPPPSPTIFAFSRWMMKAAELVRLMHESGADPDVELTKEQERYRSRRTTSRMRLPVTEIPPPEEEDDEQMKKFLFCLMFCWFAIALTACAVESVDTGEYQEPGQETAHHRPGHGSGGSGSGGTGGASCTENITCPSPGGGYWLSSDQYVGGGCISCTWTKTGGGTTNTGACTTCPLPVSCQHAASCSPNLPCTTWTCTST